MITPRHTVRSTSRARRGGFTLPEVIAAIVIIGALGGLAGAILFQGVDAYRGVSVRADLHSALASAVDRIDRALREIPSLTADGVPSLKGISPSSVDWDEADGGANITLDGDQLLLGYAGTGGYSILSGVTAFTVQCYDQSNTALATSMSGAALNNVRRIEITITAAREGLQDTLRTRVFLRCTMAGGDS